MIIVCGDFHAEFSKVNQFLASHPEVSMILQCGDFGFWPRLHGKTNKDIYGKIHTYDQYSLKNKNTMIFWCDGNHEDFESIKKLEDFEIMKNVFYMERGTILDLADGRKVLFIGGALSIDRKYRIIGESWFPEETITQKDIMKLPDENIDIVISHTAPNEFNIIDYHDTYGHDPSRDALSFVLNKYKPKLWYHGHMHLFKQGNYNGCKWTCLSAAGFDQRWWIPLEERENE